MKIQKLIYEAYARSGGRPEWVESDAFVFDRQYAHLNFEELVCLVRKRLAKTESPEQLESNRSGPLEWLRKPDLKNPIPINRSSR